MKQEHAATADTPLAYNIPCNPTEIEKLNPRAIACYPSLPVLYSIQSEFFSIRHLTMLIQITLHFRLQQILQYCGINTS